MLEHIITKLKQKKNAIVLAHSYVPEDVFPVADATGDSLELCRYAQQTGASLIIFKPR